MFDTKNRLLTMLDEKQIPVGMQCFSGHPALIEVMGLAGFDFVMLDTEHSPANPRALEGAVMAADSVGLVCLVRIPEIDDEASVRRAMEAGAQGLFVPMAKSAADIRRVLDAALFPPVGARGICPSTRAARYSYTSFVEYAEWNNRNLVVLPLIEHPDAVDNIDEICAIDQVRIIAFGAGDLAYSMGEGTNQSSPRMREAYQKVKAAAKRHGVAIMGGPVLDPTAEGCRKALEDGVTAFCLGLDIMGFRRFCEESINAAHASVQGSSYSRPKPPASAFPGR